MKDFTLCLALLDACPVLFFGTSMLIIASKFHNTIFFIGAICSFLAGLGKVAWKLGWACFHKDVRILSNQFKYMMSLGFFCMMVSVVLARVDFALLLKSMCKMPSVLFFGIGLLCMGIMGIMAKIGNQEDAKTNWLEETVNTVAQLCILIGIYFV